MIFILAPSMWQLNNSNELVAKCNSKHHSGVTKRSAVSLDAPVSTRPIKEIPKPPGIIGKVKWEKPLVFSFEQNRWLFEEHLSQENIIGNFCNNILFNMLGKHCCAWFFTCFIL